MKLFNSFIKRVWETSFNKEWQVCSLSSETVLWLSYFLLILSLQLSENILFYAMCHPSGNSYQLQGWQLPLLWTSDDPLKFSGGRRCVADPMALGAAASSGLQPSGPGWQNMQGLWPATSKLRYISSWCKFLKQAKTTGCFKKKKKKNH